MSKLIANLVRDVEADPVVRYAVTGAHSRKLGTVTLENLTWKADRVDGETEGEFSHVLDAVDWLNHGALREEYRATMHALAPALNRDDPNAITAEEIDHIADSATVGELADTVHLYRQMAEAANRG